MTISVLHCRLFILVTLLTCIITLVTGCVTSGGLKVEQPVDDLTITKSFKSKMATDPELSKLNIRVASRQGEVTLSGTVPSREIKTRLIKLALFLSGVKSVKDDLTIRRSGSDLRSDLLLQPDMPQIIKVSSDTCADLPG